MDHDEGSAVPTSKRWILPLIAVAITAIATTEANAQPTAAASARDRDHDGLPDGWERRHGLSTKRKSAGGDPDRDGLSNRREHKLRTNPRKADTDGDGVKDGREVRRGTNPRKRPGNGGGGGGQRAGAFPNPGSTGVPANWSPKQTRSGDVHVRQSGAVVQDLLIQGGDLLVEAPNVTVRRVKLQGGSINNFGGGNCNTGLTIEDTSLEPAPGQDSSEESEGVVGTGGYTARRVEIWRRSEGFRVGGKSDCGPVRIEDSFAKIVLPQGSDVHSDGIQGYDGGALTVSNVTIDFDEAERGTAPFFVPGDQGNISATVDRLLVTGGGFPFRMGVPGSVTGLKIVDRSWEYGPISVGCSQLSAWDAEIVRITPDYQVSRTVRKQPCNTQGDG